MARLKTFLIYVLILVGFIILSEFLINVSLNSSYSTIGRKDNLEQVIVYQAEATQVNARIKGTIENKAENPITSKYIRIDIYSTRGNIVGTKYIDVSSLAENQSLEFSIYFKAEDVKYYEVTATDEKATEDLNILSEDMSKADIVFLTMLSFMIFW